MKQLKPMKASDVKDVDLSVCQSMQSVLFNIGEDGTIRISLWVDDHLKDDGSREKFYVSNGDWHGVYCKGSIHIDFTNKDIYGYYVGYFCEVTDTLYKRDGDFLVEVKSCIH